MKGLGRVFKRTWKNPDGTVGTSPNWSVAFYVGRREVVESSGTSSETAATAFLKKRMAEAARGELQPRGKIFLTDLIELLKADYAMQGNRSLRQTLYKIVPIAGWFEGVPVASISYETIAAYTTHRLAEGKSTATVNGELRLLRRMFKLAKKHKRITSLPDIEVLSGENHREGFIDPEEFRKLLAHFEDPSNADLVEFLYCTGWRVSVGKKLEWRDVDMQAGTVIMRREVSKNKSPVTLPFFGQMEAIFRRRLLVRNLGCPFVFHRGGRQIKNFRVAWKAATKAAGVPALIVHDLCRSVARNLIHAGIDESTASKFMNRKTKEIFKLYQIVDGEDLRQAGAKLDALYTQSHTIAHTGGATPKDK